MKLCLLFIAWFVRDSTVMIFGSFFMTHRSKLSALCGFVKGKTVTAEFKSTFKSLASQVENNDKHSVKEPSRIVMAQKRTFVHLPDVCWLNY